MKLILRFIFSGWMTLMMWGCDFAPSGGNRYEKMSTAYCECTAHLAALNRQAEAARPDQLMGYFQKMQSEYTKAKECTATIVGQFGRLKTAEMDTLNRYLQTKCPELADHRDLLQEMLGE